MADPFAARITTAPRPHDPDRAAEAEALFADQEHPVRALLAGTAGCSGYLRGLMQTEAFWLREAMETPVEASLAALLADMDPAEASVSLRRAKRRGALLIALCDLGGVWDLEAVTAALSELADRAIGTALDAALSAEIAKGRLPGVSAEDAATGSGLFVLAMGKLGAHELNYSSDVDLIVLFDETRHDPADYAEVRRGFIRVTQRVMKILGEPTADGYVFRTDLRLRPDPSVTPVCIATEPAERYYESMGRTWERAAFIKARPCAGALEAGQAFLERLRPFIWRRHLDFAAIQDAHDMRLRIRAHKTRTGPLRILGHDLKLGRGGIREIEFFTQTRQLIGGGRDPGLRARGTRAALGALTERDWVEPETRAVLDAAYVRLRTLEHRLQMLDDAQTHAMPGTASGLARLKEFCLAGPDFEHGLQDLLEEVHARTEPFFAPGPAPVAAPVAADVFRDPKAAEGLMAGWRQRPALRSERARAIFERVEPALLDRLRGTANPDEALKALDAFVSRLPSGVQIFSLLDANPTLMDLLVDICGTTPDLAMYLGRNAGVFDAVISSDFYRPLSGAAAKSADLEAALASLPDYETVLNRARIWMKERHFRIGVHLLRGLADADAAAVAYSAVAEAVLRGLLPQVGAEFAARHGPPPGRGAVVVAMGKLGSNEMTVSSDLDLIVIYDATGADASEGRRPLAAPAYYARLTQALIAALSAPLAEGVLYKVDMRLRPSGRQGPVAVALESFRRYQAQEAWTWEHLALTRARPIAGPADLLADVEAAIATTLHLPRDAAQVLADARDMRRRLAEAREASAEDAWEVKLGPGRMLDIELLAQTGALLANLGGVRRPRDLLGELGRRGWLRPEAAGRLGQQLHRLTTLQQLGRLASGRTGNPADGGTGLTRLVLAATGEPDLGRLAAVLGDDARDCARLIDERLAAA